MQPCGEGGGENEKRYFGGCRAPRRSGVQVRSETRQKHPGPENETPTLNTVPLTGASAPLRRTGQRRGGWGAATEGRGGGGGYSGWGGGGAGGGDRSARSESESTVSQPYLRKRTKIVFENMIFKVCFDGTSVAQCVATFVTKSWRISKSLGSHELDTWEREFKLPWRKTGLLKSSRRLSGFGPVGCQ